MYFEAQYEPNSPIANSFQASQLFQLWFIDIHARSSMVVPHSVEYVDLSQSRQEATLKLGRVHRILCGFLYLYSGSPGRKAAARHSVPLQNHVKLKLRHSAGS
jgi:hypothetical protein